MDDLSRVLKRKRDAEARLRGLDSAKNITYDSGGGGYSNPPNDLSSHIDDYEDHIADPDAHHDEDHASRHAAGGTDELTPASIGAATVVRQGYVDTDTIVVEHNFGARPLVQAIGGAGPAYGMGDYGDGDYGGSADQSVISPSNIIHNSVNQVTVVLSAADTGEVVVIG